MPTALILHHNPVQLHLLSTFLEEDGLQVIRTQNAESALRLLHEQRAVDALIVDLDMPGIDGAQLCRLLRNPAYRFHRDIPLILMSSQLSDSEGRRATTELGGHAFVSLPVAPSRLRDCVHHVLDGDTSPEPRRIFIIHDNRASSVKLRQSCKEQGWIVQATTSAMTVQKRIREASPDIVIIHDPLPTVAALKLLEEIRSESPTRTIIFVTSDSDPHVASLSLQYGADEYVREPYDPEYLAALCMKVQRRGSLHAADGGSPFSKTGTRQTTGRFEAIGACLKTVVMVTDVSGVIRYVNAEACLLLGWSDAELLGQSISMLEPTWKQAWHDMGERSSLQSRPTRFLTRTGEWLDVAVTYQVAANGDETELVVLASPSEQPQPMNGDNRPVSDHGSQPDEVETMNRIAGGIAHDVNNILTAIQGHASILTHQVSSKGNAATTSEVIQKAARRGQELTAQLLGMARRHKERRSSVNVHDIIQEVLALIPSKRLEGIQIQQDLKACDPWVRGDADQFHQVLFNLVLNACDAMPEGGVLTVSTSCRQGGRGKGKRKAQDSTELFLEVTIKDTGCGIPKGLEQKIFEPFFTTKGKGQGSGMGLSVVKDIVENSGGWLSMVTAVERGSEFHVFFPQCSSQVPPRPAAEGSESPKGRVLVVDDDDMVAQTAAEILRMLGYAVCGVVSSGKQAVECYRQHQSEIDLILLDYVMADMDGGCCFRTLKDINSSIKVILTSGFDQNHVIQELFDDGLAGFVQKPFDIDELSQVLRESYEVAPGGTTIALSDTPPLVGAIV